MQSSDSSLSPSSALSDDCENVNSQDNHNVIARSRWRILAQALHKNGSSSIMPSSIRRFQSYGLVTALPLQNISEDGAMWYEYSATIGQDLFSVLVRHPQRYFTAYDLMGFNNTGNICVWPSEEILAYYGLCNRHLFSGKSILEVGGGMSCLAGLMIGKYTSASKVHLTDGNTLSMENVGRILEKNGFGESTRITSSVLQWGKDTTVTILKQPTALSVLQYDIILCADCLFFDDVRQDLVQTIFNFMSDDGVALVTAPRRAGTLEKFCEEASNAGFVWSLKEVYNEHIWDRHLQIKANNIDSYDENLHYPLLLQLQKASACQADYWKSQPRKQCEFCKCWIADNKPSIAFHENGKKHKENVAKRLSEISKKSAKDAKQQVQVDKEMKKMEEAALKAYMKDIQDNADFTSKLLLDGLEQKQKAAEQAAEQQAEAKKAKEAAKVQEKIEMDQKRKRVKEKASTTKWYEAKSDEGYSYYWHTDTNETKWHAPAEGYITISEQKVLEQAEKADVNMARRKDKSKPGPGKKRKSGEGSAQATYKKRFPENKVAEPPRQPPKVSAVMGPAPKPNPYGLWKAVETKVEEKVDWQLPSQPHEEVNSPALVEDRPKIKFHEKKVTMPIQDDPGSSQSSFVGFKKKGNFRGNMRQRLETDD
ncbi:Calmodulin-lysine N-methyltransferase [Frankliniella fusca]|uniref:Calmodulin-lysine N-methyltransferase n=1 Tax=Frankliniella fusca TaxID=407009 RepID=A0AAE1H4S7_9NEOP|nr:Calmodulin-lysine N-methyltransferase [Frankliniella fusca]